MNSGARTLTIERMAARNNFPPTLSAQAARRLLAACWLALAAGATCAQTLPDPAWPDLRPELHAYLCPVGDGQQPVATTEAERLRFEMRARYRDYLPAFLARVGAQPAAVLLMPVEGVRVANVAATFGASRGNRPHDGIDIFAPRGTPVRAAAPGFVYRIDDLSLGGLSVTVVGDGGVRYFYTHFDSVPETLVEGQYVDVETLIGFVGNSGNAASTPTHLHLGMYLGEADDLCAWRAVDPLPLLIDR